MASNKRKVSSVVTESIGDDNIQLFEQHVEGKATDESTEDDTTDSEESVYSGLEEEEEEETSQSEESDEEGGDKSGDSSDVEMKSASSGSEEEESGHEEAILGSVANSNQKKKGDSLEENGKITKVASGPDEYEYDSSDEEDIRNTVGNVPMEWYRDYPHLGYDVEGKKIIKPKKGDELDEFLEKMDNPNYWRTVTNKMTGQNIVLSEADLKTIQRLQSGNHPAGTDGQFEPWIDFFTYEKMIHPVTNHPAQKRSFIPSKWEKLKVGQMVHALKMGWMKPSKPKTEMDEEEEPQYYMLWKDEEESEDNKRFRQHIPAPKLPLPGHAESYNPPPEYLFTKEEEEKWKEQEPDERRINFVPKKYSSMRLVPAYPRFINERFERCLDLYLCPRQRKMRMNVNPEDLIPKLPKPKDLQPFPTTQAIIYNGHTDMVRCIAVAPAGQWLASGSDDKTVRLWEVSTGRCVKTLHVEQTVTSISWNPNPAVWLLAVTIGQTVLLLNPGLGDKLVHTNTDNIINSYEPMAETSQGKKVPVDWHVYEGKEYNEGFRLKLPHPKDVTQVTWHGKGDYFATVMPHGDSQAVLIHQLSKRRSQAPFSKPKGLVQCVLFHPVKPFLFVATQRYVRVYNLLKQELSKKLMTNCQWVSSMAVHPGGDNVIVGSYDCRLSWFDLDLSTKPYQTLRHHKKAVRQVSYHHRYPLFASASDDGTVIVCHGMVYNDLLQNPLIVPVKVLRGHTSTKDLGVLSCVFHPTQPWLFTSGADSTIRLYT